MVVPVREARPVCVPVCGLTRVLVLVLVRTLVPALCARVKENRGRVSNRSVKVMTVKRKWEPDSTKSLTRYGVGVRLNSTGFLRLFVRIFCLDWYSDFYLIFDLYLFVRYATNFELKGAKNQSVTHKAYWH